MVVECLDKRLCLLKISSEELVQCRLEIAATHTQPSCDCFDDRGTRHAEREIHGHETDQHIKRVRSRHLIPLLPTPVTPAGARNLALRRPAKVRRKVRACPFHRCADLTAA